jgi:hypothetical protein
MITGKDCKCDTTGPEESLLRTEQANIQLGLRNGSSCEWLVLFLYHGLELTRPGSVAESLRLAE